MDEARRYHIVSVASVPEESELMPRRHWAGLAGLVDLKMSRFKISRQ